MAQAPRPTTRKFELRIDSAGQTTPATLDDALSPFAFSTPRPAYICITNFTTLHGSINSASDTLLVCLPQKKNDSGVLVFKFYSIQVQYNRDNPTRIEPNHARLPKNYGLVEVCTKKSKFHLYVHTLCCKIKIIVCTI